MSLTELDLDPRRGSVLVRRGKGGRRREIGMDVWGFEHIQPWLEAREKMPVGPLFCVLDGRTRGRAWSAGAAREALYLRAARAGVRRRFAPHQLRHAHAIELAREGVPLNIIQRQLGHQNLGVTSIYLQGIDPGEIIETIHARRPPMIPASAGLDLRRSGPAAGGLPQQRHDGDRGSGDVSAVLATLIDEALAADADSDRRRRAIDRLQRRHDHETFDAALALCRSGEPRRRVLGIEVLAQFGFLAEESERPFRENTVRSLLELAETERSVQVLRAIGTAFGHLHDARAIDLLVRLAGNRSEVIRLGAVEGLLGHDDDRASTPS